MTSLERAKTFLQRKGRVIALTAVPLASLVAISAPTAKAGPVTPVSFNVAPCSVSAIGGTLVSGGSTSSCTTQQVGTGSNGITGVKLFGSGSATANIVFTQAISGGVTAGNPLTLDFFASGGTNGGNVFGVIPLHYAFSVTDGSDPSNANIIYELILKANNVTFFDFTSPSAIKGDGTLITGDLSTSNLPSTPVTSYSIEFKVTDQAAVSGQLLSVTIPPNSVAINQASGVPEPGTLGLLGAALAGIGALVWRRGRKS